VVVEALLAAAAQGDMEATRLIFRETELPMTATLRLETFGDKLGPTFKELRGLTREQIIDRMNDGNFLNVRPDDDDPDGEANEP